MTALKLVPLVLAACVTVSPSGKLITQSPKVAAFHAVHIASGIDATITRGPTSLKIEADEAVLPYLETRVDAAGVLHVGLNTSGVSFRRTGKIIATIATPALDGVEASGGSTVNAVMTAAKKCELGGSGGSEITVSALTCEELEIDMSGGSKLEAVGTAKKIDISASGGATVGVGQVSASVVSVDASGGSEVRTFASAELKADLSGGTELYIAGRPPARTIEASGGAQIVDIP